jgi:hypothetical protein
MYMYSEKQTISIQPRKIQVKKCMKKFAKLWQVILLSIIPLTTGITALSLKHVEGPSWLLTKIDPDYPYLLNSLHFVNLNSPRHTDHPGTTVQLFGALVLKISYFIQSLLNQMIPPVTEAVLGDPETYLGYINFGLIVLIVISTFLVGFISLRLCRMPILSLTLQITPFLMISSLEAMTRVNPEPLLICVAQFLVILLAIYTFSKDVEEKAWFAVALGIVFGIGIVTKVTFVPLLFFFLLLPNTRQRVITAAVTCATFVLFTISIIDRYERVARWFLSIATRTGNYGQGGEGFVEPTSILPSFAGLISQEPSFFILFAVSIISGSILAVFRLPNMIEDGSSKSHFNKTHNLFGVTLLVMTIQIVITVKHPGVRYLIPAMSLCGLIIFLQTRLFLLVAADRKLTRTIRFMPPILLSICIAIAIAQTAHSFQIAPKYYADIKHIQNVIHKDYPNCAIASVYPASSIESALTFGNKFAGRRFTSTFSKLYPNAIFYDSDDSNIDLKDLLKQGCVTLQTKSLSISDYQKSYPQNNIKLVLRTDTESLYYVTDSKYLNK